MQIRYPDNRPKYEKEYREAIEKRSQRIPVYKEFCVGDLVYYEGAIKAIVWRDKSPYNIEIIFEDSFNSGLVEKEYIEKTLTLERDPRFDFLENLK